MVKLQHAVSRNIQEPLSDTQAYKQDHIPGAIASELTNKLSQASILVSITLFALDM